MKKTKNKLFTTANMAKIAVLSALSFALMLFDFPLPFIPPFYQMDFSELGVMLGGFALGPTAAVCIEGMKIILKVLFAGSETAYVGELANFIIGCAFVVPASIYYARHKSKKAALIGMSIGTLIMTIVGCFINALLLLPMYSVLYQIPMDALIGMGSALIPVIHDKWTFVMFAVGPFNIIKGVLVSLLTSLIYKHVSSLLRK